MIEVDELEIAKNVLRHASAADIQTFKETTFDDLIEYHHSLGRMIRNTYGLWQRKWEPDLFEGVDVSPHHPDAVSMRIIQNMHRLLHEELV